MKIFALFFVLLLCILLMCCSQIVQEDLYGSWQALSVVDAGDTVAVDLSATQLVIEENGNFRYQTTPLNHYQGTYEVNRDLISLYSAEPLDTFVVQVLKLDENELNLRMNHKGVERHLSMRRPE